jgi:hypothetical protein
MKRPKCFAPGNDPIPSFRLDSLEDDSGHGRHILEGSRVALIPNLPRDQHEKGSHGFPSSTMSKGDGGPPMFDAIKATLRGRDEVMNVKPFLDIF